MNYFNEKHSIIKEVIDDSQIEKGFIYTISFEKDGLSLLEELLAFLSRQGEETINEIIDTVINKRKMLSLGKVDYSYIDIFEYDAKDKEYWGDYKEGWFAGIFNPEYEVNVDLRCSDYKIMLIADFVESEREPLLMEFNDFIETLQTWVKCIVPLKTTGLYILSREWQSQESSTPH